MTSFGLYQTYYEESLLQTSSASAISWIGSVQGFLLMLGGPVSGVIFDAGHLRFLLVAGCTMIVTGLMLTSIAKEYWQVLLAQAILVGLGGSLLNVPSIAVSATYFRRKRSLAQGIGASGSSIGNTRAATNSSSSAGRSNAIVCLPILSTDDIQVASSIPSSFIICNPR